jgi:hypothetical protein
MGRRTEECAYYSRLITDTDNCSEGVVDQSAPPRLKQMRKKRRKRRKRIFSAVERHSDMAKLLPRMKRLVKFLFLLLKFVEFEFDSIAWGSF